MDVLNCKVISVGGRAYRCQQRATTDPPTARQRQQQQQQQQQQLFDEDEELMLVEQPACVPRPPACEAEAEVEEEGDDPSISQEGQEWVTRVSCDSEVRAGW